VKKPRVATVRDTRTVDEITEDDLNMVAGHVKEKRYDSIYVSYDMYVQSIDCWNCTFV